MTADSKVDALRSALVVLQEVRDFNKRKCRCKPHERTTCQHAREVGNAVLVFVDIAREILEGRKPLRRDGV